MMLPGLVRDAARRVPDALAVVAPDGEATYQELDALANGFGSALAERGVRAGDRVAIWRDKSVPAIAAMQGVLRLGAVYVPLDPQAPPGRVARLIADCEPSAIVTSPERAESLAGLVPDTVLYTGAGTPDAQPLPAVPGSQDDLAYILYTSGSTGEPKGVCLTHRNALAFVSWAAAELRATGSDRLANHAPLHFDLSVLDLYVAFAVGASVHLVPTEMAYHPGQLVRFMTGNRITVWYSVPAALVLMLRHGDLPRTELPALRALLFAGEPFPVIPLRQLREHLPGVRMLNLYGPTETNVCTAYEVRSVPAERTRPMPIGTACCGDTVRALLPDGTPARAGQEAELVVSGPTVMAGYWGRQAQTGPYHTGDIVRVLDDGGFEFVGRTDAMVKVRGHRVELGEIETVLQEHPAVDEAAAVVTGTGVDAAIAAFLTPADETTPTLLDIKRHCAQVLPRYAIVDRVHQLAALPRTGNGKLDRRRLEALAAEADRDSPVGVDV